MSHTLVITAEQAFTQHSSDVIQSQHALPVPKDTSPAVLSGAVVSTHLHVRMSVMHPCTRSRILANTEPHTNTRQRVHNVWHCCLQAPLFAGKGLGLSQASLCALVQTAGFCQCTWELMSESTLCQSSHSAQGVDMSG